ncbi:MAG: xylulokinase [Frankiaceae bacterium]|jgi:xylulokinase|nr:xylulokinase [Frankiaceae bacterium]
MPNAAAVTVGIDIGTTSVKAVAVDGQGQVVARTRVAHQLEASADRLRHDADKAWRRGPRRALAALGDVQPRAVSVTGMVPSMTAVDRRGRPLTAGLLYGDAAGRRAERGGLPDLVGDAQEFLRALAREVPDAAGYWSAQTTATVALGGPPVIAADVAQVLWPLVQGGQWDQATLDDCKAAAEQVPQIVANRTPVADVGGTLLDGGAIDVMCERLASGVADEGDVLVICGSTLVVMARLRPGATTPPSILAYPDAGGAMTATAASNAGGLFLNWVDRTVAKPRGALDPEQVPVWVPYIRGERTPWNDPQRRAAMSDIHLGHDAAAVRRAAHEATGFVTRHLLELMDVSPRRIVAVGGGTQVDGWMQALADCVSAPVDAATEPDTAAIGAAFLARMTAGLETDLSDAARWARPTRRFEPEPDWAAAVNHRYGRFRELVG